MASEEASTAGRKVTRLPTGQVKVTAGLKLTLPLPGEGFTGSLTVEVKHSRLAKSSSNVEIAKAFRLVDEMNEEELGRQMKKYLRMVKRTRKEIEAGEDSGSTINTGSARERALASLNGKKKKRKKGKK